MQELANADIRKAAKDAGVSLWELADEQGFPTRPCAVGRGGAMERYGGGHT